MARALSAVGLPFKSITDAVVTFSSLDLRNVFAEQAISAVAAFYKSEVLWQVRECCVCLCGG